jgi:hypothetical protein
MAKERKTRVRLALLCGALAMAAALILSGALVLAAALVPIRVPHTSTAESTPRPVGTLLAEPGAADTRAEHLTIRESPVAVAEVMGPGRFEYNDQLSDDARAQIEALRTRAAERSLAQGNDALAPFGYRLESRSGVEGQRTLYEVYRQGESEPLLAGLAPIWPVSVSASGTEFVLAAENTPGARPPYVLVRNG